MKQYILSSFISGNGGGNKAGVVFDDRGLSEASMKAIARKNNYSETAFVDLVKCKPGYFSIRYFTPQEEVDICGHAALAAFYALREDGFTQSYPVYHLTKAGSLEVQAKGDIILIEMKYPERVEQIPKEDVLKITNLRPETIMPNPDGGIDVVSTGLRDIIVEVDSLRTLRELSIKRSEMVDYCCEKDFVGMHVVSRETIERDSDFCCRNFAPAVGIDEESATGTSNASMLYYMLQHKAGMEVEKLYKVEQGYFMQSPSNIFVSMKSDGRVFVGGRAIVERIEEI